MTLNPPIYCISTFKVKPSSIVQPCLCSHNIQPHRQRTLRYSGNVQLSYNNNNDNPICKAPECQDFRGANAEDSCRPAFRFLE